MRFMKFSNLQSEFFHKPQAEPVLAAIQIKSNAASDAQIASFWRHCLESTA